MGARDVYAWFTVSMVGGTGNQTLTVTDDGIKCLLAQVMNEIDTEEDALQLLKKGIDGVEKNLALAGFGDDGVNQFVMTVNHGLKLGLVALITVERELGSGNQLVSDAAKGTDHYNHGLSFRLCLYNTF